MGIFPIVRRKKISSMARGLAVRSVGSNSRSFPNLTLDDG